MSKTEKCALCDKILYGKSIFTDMCNRCAYQEEYISDETYLKPTPPNGLQRLRKIQKEKKNEKDSI